MTNGVVGARRLKFVFGLVLAGLFVLALSSGTVAYADEFNFTTSGSFVGGVGSDGNSTLSITGTTATVVFSAITAGTANPGDDGVSLGSLTLNAGTGSGFYTGAFALDLTITGFSGNPFVALMDGVVSASAGAATLVFNPITEQFTDSSGDVFDVTLDANPIIVSSSDPTVDITAAFSADPGGSNTGTVPEPSTLLLSAVGLAGLFLVSRRRLVSQLSS